MNAWTTWWQTLSSSSIFSIGCRIRRHSKYCLWAAIVLLLHTRVSAHDHRHYRSVAEYLLVSHWRSFVHNCQSEPLDHDHGTLLTELMGMIDKENNCILRALLYPKRLIGQSPPQDDNHIDTLRAYSVVKQSV